MRLLFDTIMQQVAVTELRSASPPTAIVSVVAIRTAAMQILITALVCACRLELAGYLLYRVLKRGKDDRFDAMRGNCGAFFGFWLFQMIWAYAVSLPAIFVNADAANPPLGTLADGFGIVMWAAGS